MKLVENFLLNNGSYLENKNTTINVTGLMLHSVGCAQPSANVFMNLLDRPDCVIGVQGIIDANDGTVYQVQKWNQYGYHTGTGGVVDYHYIGVEMCEPDAIKYTSGSRFTVLDKEKALACVNRTYKSAVELFAMLCIMFNLDPLADGVIISHKEGHARGIASNHGDPEHLWNGTKSGHTMDQFRKDVKAEMIKESKTNIDNDVYRVRKSWVDSKTQIGAFTNLSSAIACCKLNSGYSVFNKNGQKLYPEINAKTDNNYLIKINKKTPVYLEESNKSKEVMTLSSGVYTIIDEHYGYGKLKSGIGWVDLSTITKI